jgi:hypothetical protein
VLGSETRTDAARRSALAGPFWCHNDAARLRILVDPRVAGGLVTRAWVTSFPPTDRGAAAWGIPDACFLLAFCA